MRRPSGKFGWPYTSPVSTRTDRVADRFRDLSASVGIPSGLSLLGVRGEDIPTLAAHALDDLCMATNPRPVTLEDVERLYREAS